jgi:pimeloyl-ACP methyl ester carboxylesterase
MPVARVNGVTLNYLQVEEPDGAVKEDLVMIHGLATNLAFWYFQYAPVFAKRFRVTLYDLRGLGRSEMTRDGYTPQNLSVDLQALMDHLGITSAHIVAHSFGGVVALGLAVRHPGRVRSLVLADTHIAAARRMHPRPEWGNRSAIQSILERHGLTLDTRDPYFGYRMLTVLAHMQMRNVEVPADLLQLAGPLMATNGRRTASHWIRLMSDTGAESQLMGDDGLTLDALSRLLFPILALYGDHSQAILTGGELLDIWPHAEFRRVRDAGHFFPTVRFDDVIAECEAFWRGDHPRRPVVRSGESMRRHFRSDRVFKSEGGWFYSTREESRIGPFGSADDASDAFVRYLAAFRAAVV